MTNTVKNKDKTKQLYAIAFDGAGSSSFGNDFARNVIIFGVDNSSSSDTSNQKNNFSVLSKRSTDDINDSSSSAEQKFSINISKENTKFCLI